MGVFLFNVRRDLYHGLSGQQQGPEREHKRAYEQHFVSLNGTGSILGQVFAASLQNRVLPFGIINYKIMKRNTYSILLYLLLAIFTASCASTRYPSDDRGGYPFPRTERDDKQKRDKDDRWEKDDDRWEREGERRGRGGRTLPFGDLGIPKGHLPPPGECKVWFPGKPPGHQPPPQSCASAVRNAPPGAWVITHEGSRYKVSIFDRVKRGVLEEILYYSVQ